MFLSTIPGIEEARALAPVPGVEKPYVRWNWRISELLRSGKLDFAPDNDLLFEANHSDALLLSHGKILAKEKLKENPLKLIRSVIHEEVEAILQIMKRQNRAKFSKLINIILSEDTLKHKYLVLVGEILPHMTDEMIACDMVSKGLELEIAIQEGFMSLDDIKGAEREFFLEIRPIINSLRHSYFTGMFFDSSVREAKIRVAQANGMRFTQVAASASKKSPEITIRELRESGEKELAVLKVQKTMKDLGFSGQRFGPIRIPEDIRKDGYFEFKSGRFKIECVPALNTSAYIFAIENEGRIIGHGVISYSGSYPNEARFIFEVHPCYRGRGYGKEALKLILAAAKETRLAERKVERVEWANQSNAPSSISSFLKLHGADEDLGFNVVETRRKPSSGKPLTRKEQKKRDLSPENYFKGMMDWSGATDLSGSTKEPAGVRRDDNVPMDDGRKDEGRGGENAPAGDGQKTVEGSVSVLSHQRFFLESLGFDLAQDKIEHVQDGYAISKKPITEDNEASCQKILGTRRESDNLVLLLDIKNRAPLALFYENTFRYYPIVILLHDEEARYSTESEGPFNRVHGFFRNSRERATPIIRYSFVNSEDIKVFPSVYDEGFAFYEYFSRLSHLASGKKRVAIIGTGTGRDICEIWDVEGIEEIVGTEIDPVSMANTEFTVSELRLNGNKNKKVTLKAQPTLEGLGMFDFIAFACPLAITETLKEKCPRAEVKKALQAGKVSYDVFDPDGRIARNVIKEASEHLNTGGKFLLLNHDVPEVDQWLFENGFQFEKRCITFSCVGEKIALYMATKTSLTPAEQKARDLSPKHYYKGMMNWSGNADFEDAQPADGDAALSLSIEKIRKILSSVNGKTIKREHVKGKIITELLSIKRDGLSLFKYSHAKRIADLMSLGERLSLLEPLSLYPYHPGQIDINKFLFKGTHIAFILRTFRTEPEIKSLIATLQGLGITEGAHIARILQSSRTEPEIKSLIATLKGLGITEGAHIAPILRTSRTEPEIKSLIATLKGLGITEATYIARILQSFRTEQEIKSLIATLKGLGIAEATYIARILGTSRKQPEIKTIIKALRGLGITKNTHIAFILKSSRT
ncbi:MAG: GNAT family N-acetyltransferase, partial [Candidatus Omnitrophica bacterium]|nr:GNAT family N-acetyltransferase [Candidatus Omnitrophota bacterium]